MRINLYDERLPESAPGAFYVDARCLDCAMCVEIAPALFAISAELLRGYVKKQPETEDELAAARKAIANCCVEAIQSDGPSSTRAEV
jgi:ferredoxin